MKVCIIGAGMGGLACALPLAKNGFEDIHVYETASNLAFVGARIQLAPNMSRILDRPGAWKDIEREAVFCKETSIREGATDDELAHVELDEIKQLYGENVIQFHFSIGIQDITSWEPKPRFTAVPKNGELYEVERDVLLVASGVKSETRRQMPKLLNHSAHVTRWIGARRHIIAYPISNNTVYNISTTQPDTDFAAAPSETYTTKGSKPAMLCVFSDFCPKIQRILNLVPDGEVCEWKLRFYTPLPTWIYGNVALVGDASHPALPRLAQGAAQTIEDSAVLGVLLGKVREGRAEVGDVLKLYKDVTKERAEMLVEWAAVSARELHLGSGRRRRRGIGVLDKWADMDVQRVGYGVDVVKVAEEEFGKSERSIRL
ncbi:FAD/NAD(P)-binding domain-containing protein [Acephala macrosclerotiorum]|nr:FAD/NAD(P)-binding domain-containing protein [Acephala macrosclerotiorum]